MFGVRRFKRDAQQQQVNQDGSVTMVDAVKKDIGLKTLQQRFAAWDEFVAFMDTTDKKQVETFASFAARSAQRMTLGAGQVGGKYAISAKNERAYKYLLTKLAHYQEKHPGSKMENMLTKLVWASTVDFGYRSIYPRDADVAVAKIEPNYAGGWKMKSDSLVD